jgi:hypothetical protein
VVNLYVVYAQEYKQAITLCKRTIKNENIIAFLMEATEHCSLSQLTEGMFEVGGSNGGICKAR